MTNALGTRLTDLLAGEVRAQLGDGRTERAAALLAVAGASDIEARKWVLALRALRPRFKAEVSELDVLVTGPTTPRLDDIELFIGRVEALARRWAALDPAGLLGLREITDEAVTRAVVMLSACQEYPIVDRVRALLQRAGGAADAGSVKSKAASAVAQTDGLKEYACHFCRTRDLDLHSSTMVCGKKETGRTTYGNTTTVYYALKYALVPRCPRCAEMHEYLRWVGYWTWAALLPLAAVLAYTLFVDPYPPAPVPRYSPNPKPGFPPLVTAALIIGGYIASGFVLRVLVSGLITPAGERGYSDVSASKGYQGLAREGFTLTVDYSKGAYGKVVKK